MWTTDLEIGVPIERPVELGEKAVLTEDEYRKRAEVLKKNTTMTSRIARDEVGNGRGRCTGTKARQQSRIGRRW